MAVTFKVELLVQLDENTQAPLLVEVHPEWAPRGAARFVELVEHGYYNGCRFHRVVQKFMAQAHAARRPAHCAGHGAGHACSCTHA